MTTGSKANVPSPWRKDLTNRGNCSAQFWEAGEQVASVVPERVRTHKWSAATVTEQTAALGKLEQVDQLEQLSQPHWTTTGPWPLFLPQSKRYWAQIALLGLHYHSQGRAPGRL